MSLAGTLFGLSLLGAFLYKVRELKLTSGKEVLHLGAAFAFVFILGISYSINREARAENYFREQFNLPESAEVVEMNMPHQGFPPRAVFDIPDADWNQFVAGLNTQPTPFLFDFTADPVTHARIAQWRDLPPVMQAADAPKHIFDIPRIYDFAWDYQVKNGKILCIVYVANSASGARSCYDSTKGDAAYSFVVGVIDFDQRRVHLHYRGNAHGWLQTGLRI